MAKRISKKPGKIVQFKFQNSTYQIDPDLKKVYKSFVEIETSKASEIMMSWRSDAATA